MLSVGEKAPSFAALDQFGVPVTLSDYKGKKVILYFYPKDMTTGCTKEACDFRDNFSTLKRLGVVVLGVSPDDEKSHGKFIEKYDLPFTLLADTEKKICQAYDVWKEKNMYGRKYMGVVRTTFVINEKGVIEKIYPKVSVTDHVKSILKDIG